MKIIHIIRLEIMHFQSQLMILSFNIIIIVMSLKIETFGNFFICKRIKYIHVRVNITHLSVEEKLFIQGKYTAIAI